jgi:hypothetical protein
MQAVNKMIEVFQSTSRNTNPHVREVTFQAVLGMIRIGVNASKLFDLLPLGLKDKWP